jgi:nuclear transcription factor Y gamma
MESNPKTKNEKVHPLKNIEEETMRHLEEKFNEIKNNISSLSTDPSKFKSHALPLARIKKIMKLDDDVKMISGETPILFSKACELFIIDLAYRSWVHTLENTRRTLQKVDIVNSISKTEYFDFLLDIVDESVKNKIAYCYKIKISDYDIQTDNKQLPSNTNNNNDN